MRLGLRIVLLFFVSYLSAQIAPGKKVQVKTRSLFPVYRPRSVYQFRPKRIPMPGDEYMGSQGFSMDSPFGLQSMPNYKTQYWMRNIRLKGFMIWSFMAQPSSWDSNLALNVV